MINRLSDTAAFCLSFAISGILTLLGAKIWIAMLVATLAVVALDIGIVLAQTSCVTSGTTTTCYTSDGRTVTCVRSGSTVTCY